MIDIAPSMTVADVAGMSILRREMLERLGIDIAHGGARPLADACVAAGVPLDAAISALAMADGDGATATTPAAEDGPWHERSLAALCDHLEQVHHAYLRRNLPRLLELADKVAKVHGPGDRRLGVAAQVLLTVAEELSGHMLKEEHVLFPMCRRLERGERNGATFCSTVRTPIRVMRHEHDSALAGMRALRALTDGYRAPDTACTTYRAFLAGLADLEQELRLHIHEEDDLLFPRALAREAAVAQRPPAA